MKSINVLAQQGKDCTACKFHYGKPMCSSKYSFPVDYHDKCKKEYNLWRIIYNKKKHIV